jgi:SAM-dependent methyltransferase
MTRLVKQHSKHPLLSIFPGLGDSVSGLVSKPIGGSVKRKLHELLRRKLSPRVYKAAITYWRYRLYWHQWAAARFVTRRPTVEGFPDRQTGGLVDQLHDVNVLAPTPMCLAMHWHGSDKSLLLHNYTTIYNALLRNSRDKPLRIFEIGLGSNNTEFAFNMGPHGVPGASLRAWKVLFPNARIFGADIDRASLFQEDRIQTSYCDQLDKIAIEQMWSRPGFGDGMDVIIDDGLHTFEGNSVFLSESLGHLRPGGTYVVEDIATSTLPRWREFLASDLSLRFPEYEYALVQLPHAFNHSDNNLLLIRQQERPRVGRPLEKVHN